MINELLEQYKKEQKWHQKCIILHLIHLGMVSENKGWRLRDTSLLVGISVAAVSEDLMIAEYIEELSDATSRNDALKRIKKL